MAVENVGDLVCPSSFDFGDAHKFVVLSVTEGDNKPLKYSDMFHAANLMIINKMDLLAYVDFNVTRCIEFARKVNPTIQILKVSTRKDEDFSTWTNLLIEKCKD